jgi:hypothetical protein
MAATFEPDWAARLRKKIYTQFYDSNFAVPLADIIGSQRGTLELLFAAVIVLWSIDTVTDDVDDPAYGVGRGVQLDRIGRLVGQARGSASDDLYRLYLRARIRVNQSNGSPENIYSVFYAFLGSTTAGELLYTPGYTAAGDGEKSFSFQIKPPITADEATVALSLIGSAKDAGARAILEWQQQADDITLSCAIGTTVAIATTPGDLFVDVPGDTDFSLFPASGSLFIDQGLGNEETVAYLSISGTFILAAPGIVNVHAIGAGVALDTGTQPFNPGIGIPAGAGVTSIASPTDTTLDISDDTYFPSAGTVVIDEGLGTEETIAYASIGAGPQLILSTPIVTSHDNGAAVVVKASGGALAEASDV